MEYQFTVYSNRWGHDDTYRIEVTNTGWNIKHMAINGPCDPSGERTLFMNLEQDYISYPKRIGDFMEYLWNGINNGTINDPKEIQAKLDDIASWISLCEQNVPKWKGWNC